MPTAAHVPVHRRRRICEAAHASSVALAAVQLAAGEVNMNYSRLFATLGVPVSLPGFELRWDYSTYLSPILRTAGPRAAALVSQRFHMGLTSSPTLAAGFLPRFTAELATRTSSDDTAEHNHPTT
ncbi:hypothetical protein [Corynebacterium sp. AOP12-C2-36]|uniref:hypothetical protein n=1 Tax=Corynebacterium sp. AOP12-C2-36 TaxID=3457723 RepID=UPI004033DC50